MNPPHPPPLVQSPQPAWGRWTRSPSPSPQRKRERSWPPAAPRAAASRTSAVLGYSALLNGTIAVLFKFPRGTALLRKDRERGTIPWWSYALFFPFHGPTYAYTHFHTLHGTMRPPYAAGEEGAGTKEADRVTVPVASEVQSGWWVGGCYAHRLGKQWAGVVDLTTEFPERCRPHTARYRCLPTWDGAPWYPA